MLTLRELENSIGKLPLAEQEALLATLERRVAEEYDRLAAESVATDMRLVEQHLAASPVTSEQSVSCVGESLRPSAEKLPTSHGMKSGRQSSMKSASQNDPADV